MCITHRLPGKPDLPQSDEQGRDAAHRTKIYSQPDFCKLDLRDLSLDRINSCGNRLLAGAREPQPYAPRAPDVGRHSRQMLDDRPPFAHPMQRGERPPGLALPMHEALARPAGGFTDRRCIVAVVSRARSKGFTNCGRAVWRYARVRQAGRRPSGRPHRPRSRPRRRERLASRVSSWLRVRAGGRGVFAQIDSDPCDDAHDGLPESTNPYSAYSAG